jgi:hypothetical protein
MDQSQGQSQRHQIAAQAFQQSLLELGQHLTSPNLSLPNLTLMDEPLSSSMAEAEKPIIGQQTPRICPEPALATPPTSPQFNPKASPECGDSSSHQAFGIITNSGDELAALEDAIADLETFLNQEDP